MRGYSGGASQKIRANGGAVFAITSEPHTLAREAETSWELDFPSVGDPHHEVAGECRERGWLRLFVNERVGLLNRVGPWVAHPKGYFQPGVLALARDGRVLYRWRGRPTRRNAGGATNRPLPEHVWSEIERALARSDGADAPLDETAGSDMRALPWPFFVLLLLANGKFRRPLGLGLDRSGPDDVERRAKRALLNLALFVGGWAAAFALLPAVWVLVAFAAWAALVTPSIVAMHRDFQSVPEGEPEAS